MQHTPLMYKTDKKKLRNIVISTTTEKNRNKHKIWNVTQGILECQFTVIHCKLYILFPLPKTVYYCKIKCNVQYSFSPCIVGELTVNHLTGFYWSICSLLPLNSR